MMSTLMAAAVRLVAVRVLVTIAGAPRMVRAFQRGRATGIDRTAALGAARAMQRAANRLPLRAKCLDRSLALVWLLSSRGLASTLQIGVRKTEDATLAAHAWVEHDGVVLLDDDAAHFAAMTRG